MLSYIYALSSFLTQKGNGTRFYTLEHLKGHSRDFHLNFSSMYLFLVVKKCSDVLKLTPDIVANYQLSTTSFGPSYLIHSDQSVSSVPLERTEGLLGFSWFSQHRSQNAVLLFYMNAYTEYVVMLNTTHKI